MQNNKKEGGKFMGKYKCVFSVNGRRTEEIISASTSIDAKKIIESKYGNCKITWWSCTKVG